MIFKVFDRDRDEIIGFEEFLNNLQQPDIVFAKKEEKKKKKVLGKE